MPFDRDRYVKTYLVPQAKKKQSTLPDDLFGRYDISWPVASEAALADHIKNIRSTWLAVSTAATQPPYAKTFAKQCLAADEMLKTQRIGNSDYHSISWWQAKKSEEEGAAQGRLDELAQILQQSNGTFGIVTKTYLDTCAEKLHVGHAQALAAAASVGLEVVGEVTVPEAAPIRQYGQLENELTVAGARTIVQLVHPEVATFSIAERFESAEAPAARLDLAAVQNQFMEAERQGNTPSWNAKRRALNLLRSAVEGGADLHQLALFQAVQSAVGSGLPGPAGTKAGLIKLGVVERDANILAVVAAERTQGPSGPAKLSQLLQDGRLVEACAIAQTIPPEASKDFESILASLEAAQAKLDLLLADASRLLAAGDEIGAAAKVREVATISRDDAEKMMVTIPIAPPLGLTIGADGPLVRLHWQPNVGHDAETTYEVRRGVGTPPGNLAVGAVLESVDGTSATDQSPPTAQPTFYSVFASAAGRPASRPATQSIVSVPPVLDPGTEVGADWVTAFWSTHGAVRRVEAVRLDAGRSHELTTNGNSARVDGAAEGSSVQIGLTALYEAPDGRVMRSEQIVVTDSPRAAARPLKAIQARPVWVSGGVQIRVTWTPVDRSEVYLRRGATPPPWTEGEMISVEQRDTWGFDVSGSVDTSGNQTRLDASLPSGIHYIVPFSKGGTGVAVGRSVAVAVTDPVVGLTHTTFNGFARLAWTWPETSSLVEVSWSRDDDATDAVGLERYSRVDYDRRGISVPLGSSPCTVEVRALMLVDGKTFSSPPQTVLIDQAGNVPITYTVGSSSSIGPFGGRSKTLNLTAAGATGPVQIQMVATAGGVLPLAPEDGLLIFDRTVSLDAGRPQSFSVQVPKTIKKPFWVRAFVPAGDRQLIDPPIATLKEG